MPNATLLWISLTAALIVTSYTNRATAADISDDGMLAITTMLNRTSEGNTKALVDFGPGPGLPRPRAHAYVSRFAAAAAAVGSLDPGAAGSFGQ